MNQKQRNARFRALHERPEAFIIPNPWDIGTARILAKLGFEALATTSTGLAFSLGMRDGAVNREQALAHCRAIVAATDLPVSADLEKGFGDRPEDVAATIRDASQTGLAGCSIEDHTNRRHDPIFDFTLAVERIQAAAEAKQDLPHDFILTARCENFLWGRPDLDDTVKRLQAFENAGADVLYGPGLHDLETIRTVCDSSHQAGQCCYGIAWRRHWSHRPCGCGRKASECRFGILIGGLELLRSSGERDERAWNL